MGLAGVGLAVAISSLGYGIYAGEKAQGLQNRAIQDAKNQADEQKQQQAQQYQDQIAQEKATTAANLATEQQTAADTKAAQAQALAAEQAAIGTNSTTLGNSLADQTAAAFAKQQPIAEGRLNSLGLLQSGALPAEQAKYQADLQSQSQAALAQYQIGAQGQLTQDTNAASANQVNQEQANALLNIQNQEQNMSQNFATTNINNQNNTAYQQYLNSLQMGQAQTQQGAANSYTGLAGQLGGGLINYYGNQNATNPSLQALQMYGNINSYANSNPNLVNSNSWNPNKVDASNSNYGYMS